jgi:hypothetical protein
MVAMSLHVGVNEVDQTEYVGWDGSLTGCENDARDMAALATRAGFVPTVLLTVDATADRVLQEIGRAAGILQPGDSFLLSFACHGAQFPSTDPSETDRKNEAVVLYDRMVLDDDINRALSAFSANVRLEMIADFCHSGTSNRAGPTDAVPREMPLAVSLAVIEAHPRRYGVGVRRSRARGRTPDVLLLSACQDGEVTGDGPTNGEFTAALLQTWANGTFAGDFREFRKHIDDLLPTAQNPNLLARTTAAQRLEDERPFSTTPLTDTETAMTTTLSNGAPATTTAVTPAAVPADSAAKSRPIPDGMPTELAAKIDITKLLNPMAGLQSAVDVQQVSELSGARPTRRSRGDSGFNFFWWGMNLKLNHEELETVLASADAVGAITGLVGGVVPGAAKAYIELIATFIKASGEVLRRVDEGYGVYISMSWFAVGMFVPTPVKQGDRSATRGGELVLNPPPFTVTRIGGVQDTGLTIQTGQRLVISAGGSVWSGIWLTGENGPGGWGDWQAGNDAPLSGEPPFSLLGRLDAQTFFVGSDLTWVHSGPPAKLYFLINDHRRIGSGSFNVRVDVFAP